MHCRTNLFYNSFYQLLKEHGTKTSLLNKQLPSHPLNIYSKHPPKEYNYRTRNGQIIYARLRMECSSLNSHLYRKNDSPSSTCGGFESPYHYFYVCPNYVNLRNECFDNELERMTIKELFIIPPPPPANCVCVCGGGDCFQVVRPSVFPSVTFWFLFNILKRQWWKFIKFCRHIDIVKMYVYNRKIKG